MAPNDFQKLLLETMNDIKGDITNLTKKVDDSIAKGIKKDAEFDTRLSVHESKFATVKNVVFGTVAIVLVSVGKFLLATIQGSGK